MNAMLITESSVEMVVTGTTSSEPRDALDAVPSLIGDAALLSGGAAAHSLAATSLAASSLLAATSPLAAASPLAASSVLLSTTHSARHLLTCRQPIEPVRYLFLFSFFYFVVVKIRVLLVLYPPVSFNALDCTSVEFMFYYIILKVIKRITYFWYTRIVYCRVVQTIGPGPKFGPTARLFFWPLGPLALSQIMTTIGHRVCWLCLIVQRQTTKS